MSHKLVCGIGVNDANYVVQPGVKGKQVCCPYYRVWHSMLKRCYSNTCHERRPTYVGCKTCDEWIYFMTFRKWMMKQDWQGKALDKDLLGDGKLYSAKACVFVTQAVNSFIPDLQRGEWPTGVCKHGNRFRAGCNGAYLGLFDTPEEAHQAWRKAKLKLCKELIKQQTDPRVKKGLRLYAKKLQAA